MLGRGKGEGRTPEERAAAAADRARRRGVAPPPMTSIEPPPDDEPLHDDAAPFEDGLVPDDAHSGPEHEDEPASPAEPPPAEPPPAGPVASGPPGGTPDPGDLPTRPPAPAPPPRRLGPTGASERRAALNLPAAPAPEAPRAAEPPPAPEAPPEEPRTEVAPVVPPPDEPRTAVAPVVPPEPDPSELDEDDVEDEPPVAPSRLGPRPEVERVRQETQDNEVADLGPLTLPQRAAPPDARVPDAPRAAPPLRRNRAGVVLRRRTPGTPPPPRSRGGGQRRSGYRRRRFGALVILLAFAVVAVGALKTFQVFAGEPGKVVRVKIPEGANFSSIANTLVAAGVVDSKTFFSLNATVTGRRGGLQPGTYSLQRDAGYGDVLDALGKGPKAAPPAPRFKVTLTEGQSINEIAKKDTGTTGSYKAAATSKRSIRRAYGLGLPRTQRTTEGYLFPATYDLLKGASSQDLVDDQLQAFADNSASVSYRKARAKNLTRYDVLIIASMVEREAQLDKDRPLIASVIYNRLSQGIPLGIDATTRYYENNWTTPLLQSQLDDDNAYNTRLNSGLPPTPIGNPGLKSIEAAANPAETDFLFFVVKVCGNGAHVFSKTDAEFQRDQARYNAARDQAGGKSPADC